MKGRNKIEWLSVLRRKQPHYYAALAFWHPNEIFQERAARAFGSL
jgi:hypothetical protein